MIYGIKINKTLLNLILTAGAAPHLGFYQTGNSAVRSTDPEKPGVEPNMEWIGCTVCDIFAFELYAW